MDGHVPDSWSPAPGVRVRFLRDRRHPTAHVRVLVHRRVDDLPAVTAVLARTLESAATAWPTRQALAWRLADLYDAALDVTVESYGGRAALVASLDWPIAAVPQAERALHDGLALLGEILAAPLRNDDGAIHAELLGRARQEVLRDLASRSDDKARSVTRRAVELGAPDHPISVPKDGRGPDVARVDGRAAASVHARLLASHPIDVQVIADATPSEVRRAVGQHLVGRLPVRQRVHEPRPKGRLGPRPAGPARQVLTEPVAQTWWAGAWRTPRRPGPTQGLGGEAASGVLGESGSSLLFQVAREHDGLAYVVGSSWHRDPGLLLVHAGVGEGKEAQLVRRVRSLLRGLARGGPDTGHLDAWKQETRERFEGVADEPAALCRWWTLADVRGEPLDPRAAGQRRLDITARTVRDVVRRLEPAADVRLRAAHGVPA
ncbi:MAG: M16 family metallopeptidase [Planctomycetota bacterium]